MRSLVITVTFVATALTNAAFAAEETLQNDGFTSGSAASFQAGFVAGEVAAARFVPQIACPCVVERVTLLFGGTTATREIGLNVWEDSAGNDAPGTLLFTGTVTLTGSNENLQEIDLTLTPIVVNGPFRVGFEFGNNGLPSVASDEDGTIDAAANFILANVGGPLIWFRSAFLGVDGDFVIRATIDNLVAADSDGDGVADNADNCTTFANANQQDTNGDGFGNACDADLNNDCIVNPVDLGIFRLVFLSADPDADLNGDGVVNPTDLGIFRSLFLLPPGPSGVPNDCD